MKNRCKVCAIALGGLSLLLPWPLSAGATSVNGLFPYDNTIDDDFWNTKSHPGYQVSQVCGSVGDFDSSGISTELSNWISFTSELPGFLLFLK